METCKACNGDIFQTRGGHWLHEDNIAGIDMDKNCPLGTNPKPKEK